jgi:hypothetical protein
LGSLFEERPPFLCHDLMAIAIECVLDDRSLTCLG